jgi:single-strand DNA-binding protein
MNYNHVVICGNMTREPDCRKLPSGQSVCSFTVATTRVYYDAHKERKEQTEFHAVVAWGKQAEILGQYGKKGGLLLITGRLQTRSWDDKVTPTFKHYRTEIIVEDFELGPNTSRGGAVPPAVGKEAEPEPAPDDIPF